jgi:hypothetical protein
MKRPVSKSTMYRGLKGKYYLHSGMEHYQFGKIVDQFGDCILMLQALSHSPKDNCPVSPMTLVDIGECLEEYDGAGDPECANIWQFFNTEKELHAYIFWLDTPALENPNKLKIVSINPKKELPQKELPRSKL